MATLNGLTVDDTGYLKLPSGPTSTRPGPTLQYFTSTGPATFNVPSGVSSVEVLVVAGGGGTGAAQYHNGGAGGGGVVYHTAFPVTPGGTVALTVGAGGTAGAGPGPGTGFTNGGNSTFGSITALGGGYGGHYPNIQGNPGGSGGGGAANGNAPSNIAGSATQPGQANPGASVNAGFPGGTGAAGPWGGGGGGGAGGAGQAGDARGSTYGGNGGPGVSISIAGYPVYYGGGGGGSGQGGPYALSAGSGGLGGGGIGGTGSINYSYLEINGRVNSGGGAGGVERADGARPGGTGGPGIVVVKYTLPANNVALTTGMTRLNTDSGLLEIYDGTWWTTYSKTVLYFTEPGLKNFTVPQGINRLWVVVVGGGGGAGVCIAGGGGAGGMVENTTYPVVPGQVIPLNVGVGGNGGHGDNSSAYRNFPSDTMRGTPSFFGDLEGIGGGGGGNYNQPGGDGGSGGGGGGSTW
jgi:hypothetical protein